MICYNTIHRYIHHHKPTWRMCGRANVHWGQIHWGIFTYSWMMVNNQFWLPYFKLKLAGENWMKPGGVIPATRHVVWCGWDGPFSPDVRHLWTLTFFSMHSKQVPVASAAIHAYHFHWDFFFLPETGSLTHRFSLIRKLVWRQSEKGYLVVKKQYLDLPVLSGGLKDKALKEKWKKNWRALGKNVEMLDQE